MSRALAESIVVASYAVARIGLGVAATICLSNGDETRQGLARLGLGLGPVGAAEAVRFERFVEILRASDRKVLAASRTIWVGTDFTSLATR